MLSLFINFNCKTKISDFRQRDIRIEKNSAYPGRSAGMASTKSFGLANSLSSSTNYLENIE